MTELMTAAPQFPFPSLDFPGRMSLRVDEVAAKLAVTGQHIIDLVVEGKVQAVDMRGLGSTRACYRIPVDCYREFVTGLLTTPPEAMRSFREFPKALLRDLRREIDLLIAE